MPFDPATLCARTAAGDAEMAAPRHGLAIAQRRLLSFLDKPLGIDELGNRPGVTPERLERDLGRLVEAGLVDVHRPAIPAAPAPPPPAARSAQAPRAGPASRQGPPSAATLASPTPRVASGPGAPVVIGRKVRRGRAFAVGFLSLAAAIAGVWYFAAPATPGESSTPASLPAAPAQVAPGARVSAAPTAMPAALPAEPVVTLAAAEPSPPQAAPAVAFPAASSSTPATRSAPPAPRVAAEPAEVHPAAPPEAAPVAASPSAPADAVPAAAPANPMLNQAQAPAGPAAAPAATTPAPVQLASATPSSVETRAQPRALAPVHRESPDFPREALAAGVDKGVVRARLSIDASGRVASVEIVESQPRRVFDRSVSRSLARWTYEPGAAGRTTDVEIAFNRD